LASAERLWPGENPIGKRFRRGGPETPLVEVVGVVADMRAVSLRQAPPAMVYVPVTSNYYGLASLAISTTRTALDVAGGVREIVRSLDRQVAVPAPRTMNDIVSDSVAVHRFEMLLVVLLAIAAALLTAVGIYGVMAQSVSQRTAEFGVRLAIGANPRAIVALVFTSMLRPVLGGLVIGLIAAGALGRFMSGVLFGVSPGDPVSFVGVSALIIVVAMLATAIPVRRAMKVAPVDALRIE
jgi:putative ABC transport system permease protein